MLSRSTPILRAAVLTAALLVGGCAGSTYYADVPLGEGWRGLPLGEMVTRDTIEAKAIGFCRKEECGYEAAVGIFSASGRDRTALDQMLADPSQLERLLRRPLPSDGKDARSRRFPPPSVEIHRINHEGWSGARIALSGGPANRALFATILGKSSGSRGDYVIAIASDADVALDAAIGATQ